jgi:acetoin utilization protein AcuB
MIARDLMSSEPVAITTTTSIRQALETLQTLEIRHLPVILADDGELIGMVSDRDLRSVPERALGEPVVSIMSSNVIAAEEEASVEEIIDLMLEHKIGAVPIVNADGDLVGIVSYIDVLRAVQGGLIEAGVAESR